MAKLYTTEGIFDPEGLPNIQDGPTSAEGSGLVNVTANAFDGRGFPEASANPRRELPTSSSKGVLGGTKIENSEFAPSVATRGTGLANPEVCWIVTDTGGAGTWAKAVVAFRTACAAPVGSEMRTIMRRSSMGGAGRWGNDQSGVPWRVLMYSARSLTAPRDSSTVTLRLEAL
jgi:hypothetical protein